MNSGLLPCSQKHESCASLSRGILAADFYKEPFVIRGWTGG
jgi:hypothetical protein